MHRHSFQIAARRRASRAGLIGTTAMVLALGAGAAHAQQSSSPPASGSTVGEVVVTGSRIAKRDFQSNSPMVTVNSQAFQNTANVAVEATLNKLPQFAPDQDLTGVQSTDVQPTATHTIGISTASLRGLGANRNLVLADGQRLQPVNGSLVVDLNSIPSSIIDHVEVVTGGASAVYGADAISGVVNFILKKNYQGMDIDAQYGVTQRGDGNEFKVSALFGTNFADDKGNVTFGLERYTRAASWEKNREFYLRGWADPTVGTNEFFNTGSFFFGPASPPSGAAVSAVFGTAPGVISPFSIFQFNNNGTLAAGTFGSPASQGGVHNSTAPVDGSHVAYQNYVSPFTGALVQGIKTNQVDDYFVTSPLNRWSLYGSAHYDITDNLTAYIRATFTSTHTATNLFPTPFITGWTTNIPFNPVTDDPTSPGYVNPGNIAGAIAAGAHPVPAQLAQLLENRTSSTTCFNTPAPTGCAAPAPVVFGPGASTTPWTLWLIPSANQGGWMPPRSSIDDNQVWQFTSGLKGKAPFKDWTWEVYGSHGQASDYTLGLGYTSLARFKALISAPDYGANTDAGPLSQTFDNTGSPNNGFGVAHIHCTSGFYGAIFLGQKPSQDCINAITAETQTHVFEEQNIVEFDAQGTLFSLPAGDVKLSLGANYRDEYVQFTPDILGSTSSFLDQIAGVYPASYEDAATSAREGYGELYVPVLKDLPLVKSFNLELGARYSTYTADDHRSGLKIAPEGGWTYKILGDWAITDWARLRGGYNLAVRSPNVGELFLAKQEVYAAGGFTQYGDPCSVGSTAPFGAGGSSPDAITHTTFPVVNTLSGPGGVAGAQSTQRICRAMMGLTGASYYYNDLGGVPQGKTASSLFSFVNQVGNPHLKAEQGHTWTAGIVLSSPWLANPWVGNLHASVDWYDIKLTHAIEFEAVDQVRQNCFSQYAPDDAAAAAVVQSPACQLYTRLPGNGNEDATQIQFRNLATVWTSGIDFELDGAWNFNDLGLQSVPGRLQLNWLLSWLNDYKSQSAPGQPILNWAGTLGPNLNGVDPGSSLKYKMNTTLTYLEGPFSLSLNWRYLPHTHTTTYPSYQIQPGGLAACGGPVGTGVNCGLDTKAFHVFDLAATYTLHRNYVIRAGIQNLFDTDPPIVGAAPTGYNSGVGLQPGGTYQAGGTLASTGAGNTNPSIYDTLGRRFYVGINAKF